ncbi:MAG: hypothetical protein M1817_003741 [Caeruleum heppii]|nr:MAG: hypothetical protein M1817_003741 [Caeruleum heppii]
MTGSHNDPRDLGLLVPNLELSTGCSPAHLPGQPPSTLAQSLSTRLLAALHTCNLIGMEDLEIWYKSPDIASNGTEASQSEIKALWTLYIDVLFISLDGNPFDAAWAAVLAALRDVKLPRAFWDSDREMVLCSDAVEEAKSLSLTGFPIPVTLCVFRDESGGPPSKSVKDRSFSILADPDSFEEDLCSESVTLTIDRPSGEALPFKILKIEKGGGGVIDKRTFRRIMPLCELRWQQWRDHMSKYGIGLVK